MSWGRVQEMDLLALTRTRSAEICRQRLGAMYVDPIGMKLLALIQEMDLLALARTQSLGLRLDLSEVFPIPVKIRNGENVRASELESCGLSIQLS